MGTSRAVTRRDPGVRYPHYPPTRHLGARVLSKQLLNVHNRGKEDGSKKCCLCDVISKAPEHLWAGRPAQDDRAGWQTRRRSRGAFRRHRGADGPCGYGSRPVTLSRRPGGQRKGHSMPASILPPPKSLVEGLLVARSGPLANHLLGCAHQRIVGDGPQTARKKEKTEVEKSIDRPNN